MNRELISHFFEPYFFLFPFKKKFWVVSKYQNEGFGDLSNSMFIENNLRVLMGVHICMHCLQVHR